MNNEKCNMIAEANMNWIAKGNTGCTFATLFAKNTRPVRWGTFSYQVWETVSLHRVFYSLVSVIFDETFDKDSVRQWAIKNNFYLESTGEETEGLRFINHEGYQVWVQYFGPDSHVVTRRTPYPMLTFKYDKPTHFYKKVGFNGILHLAHSYLYILNDKIYDVLWDRSHAQTCKKIGHKPTIKEAAKTTFLK